MFMLQAAGAPIVVETDDNRKLLIPKLTMDDIINWGAEIQAERENTMTEGMDENRRREYLQVYPVLPPSVDEMRRLIRTPLGMMKVLLTCFVRAQVKEKKTERDLPSIDEAQARQMITKNGTYRMVLLAIMLADLEDTSNIVPPDRQPDQRNGDGSDPLMPTGTGASRRLPVTGMPISRPSTPPTVSALGGGGHTPSSKEGSEKQE